jgi:hypothetical protein
MQATSLGNLDFQGPVTVQFSSNSVHITIQKIVDNSSSYTSGSLRIDLWALPSPYAGGAFLGFQAASVYTRQVAGLSDRLQPGGSFSNASLTLPYSAPPAQDSSYVLLLLEYNPLCPSPDSFCIAAYVNVAASPVSGTGTPYTISDRGAVSLITSGNSSATQTGYGRVQVVTGTTPSGVAIFGYQQNNVLVSETGVPASLPLSAGRIYAEVAPPVNTGIAIANPNNSAVTINFFFTDGAGNDLGSGSTTIAANGQTASFLSEKPYNRTAPFQGTFSFTSTLPVAVVALRGFTNERSEFLESTLPVIDTTAALSSGIQVLPHYADGGGWTTQILLVNPTNTPLTGNVQFFNAGGTAFNVTIAGQTTSSLPYSVPPRSSQKLVTGNPGNNFQRIGTGCSGWSRGAHTPGPVLLPAGWNYHLRSWGPGDGRNSVTHVCGSFRNSRSARQHSKWSCGGE